MEVTQKGEEPIDSRKEEIIAGTVNHGK